MKILVKIIFSTIILLFLSQVSTASNCHNKFVVVPNYYNNVVYTPVVQQIVEVPLYSISYDNPNSDPYQLEELTKQIKLLNKNVQYLQKQQSNFTFNLLENKQEEVSKHEKLLTFLNNNCYSCHNPTNAKKGFSVFDKNNDVALSSEQMLKIIDRVFVKKDMPPGKNLSDSERSVVFEGVGIFNGEKK